MTFGSKFEVYNFAIKKLLQSIFEENLELQKLKPWFLQHQSLKN